MDHQDSEDSDIYPQGIKWYGETISASRYLPRGCMMPVEVWLDDGSKHIWMSLSRDWRPVIKWRQVRVTAGTARKLRAQQHVQAQDLELA